MPDWIGSSRVSQVHDPNKEDPSQWPEINIIKAFGDSSSQAPKSWQPGLLCSGLKTLEFTSTKSADGRIPAVI